MQFLLLLFIQQVCFINAISSTENWGENFLSSYRKGKKLWKVKSENKISEITKKINQKLQQKNVKNLKLIFKKQFFQILKIMQKLM
jgi:hypothetical protein